METKLERSRRGGRRGVLVAHPPVPIEAPLIEAQHRRGAVSSCSRAQAAGGSEVGRLGGADVRLRRAQIAPVRWGLRAFPQRIHDPVPDGDPARLSKQALDQPLRNVVVALAECALANTPVSIDEEESWPSFVSKSVPNRKI